MAANTTGKFDDFCLPDLGEGLEDADLLEWCVHPGQRVKEDDTLARMETAKAVVDIPSPRAGLIAALHGQPGQTIKVGSPLVTYRDEPGEVQENTPAAETPPAAEAATRSDAGTVVGDLAAEPSTAPSGKALATPAVRRLAREVGVDIESVAGTGIGGRVTAPDVEAAASGNHQKAPPVPRGNGHAKKPAAPAHASTTSRVPLRGVRKTIAEHLRYSVSHAVHYTVMDEADVTALDHLRRKLVAASNEKISFLPFVAFAVCRVLSGQMGKQFAILNSTVDDETQEIVLHRSVHLGIATDTEAGLVVPVIRNADRLGTLEMSRRIAELARAARDRSLPPNQLSGSTFTISNFGSVGGRFGTPIINYPEAAILAVGRAREGVVVRDRMLGVGKVLPLSLSADHRVIDGATAATSLARIMDLLQSPERLMPDRLEEPA